jgi:hypothetical protein
MSRIENVIVGALLLAGLLAAGWFGLDRYGDAQFEAGRAAALAAGEKVREHEAKQNRHIETDLRDQLLARDVAAHRKDQEYATTLEAAQRRVRAGTDRLRCPAGAVQPATAATDRPATTEPDAYGLGPELMSEAAEALLGDAADVAGLVRRYDRVVERFEACRALNAK